MGLEGLANLHTIARLVRTIPRLYTTSAVFRKPEPIEITILGISFLLLCSSAAFFYRNTGASAIEFPEVVYLAFVVIGLCLLGEVILMRASVRFTVMLIHSLLFIVLIDALENRFVIIELMMIFVLIIQISLRFSILYGSFFGGVVLLAAVSIGFSSGGVMSDRAYVFLLGGLFIFLGETIKFYREQLVEKSNALNLSRRSLTNLTAANHSFVAHLEDVEADSAERERFRITRELHDSIGYSMTNIAMMMNASRHLIEENPDKLVEYCQSTKSLASSTLHETREILYKLRAVGKPIMQSPPIFFARLCRDFTEATGVVAECNSGNLPAEINERVFNAVFRTIQVGFINALRHGAAGHIRVFFWLSEAELRMTIWNSMQEGGQAAFTITEGIGLKGIRERLEVVDGNVSFGQVIDGFELVITIPRREVFVGVNLRPHR